MSQEKEKNSAEKEQEARPAQPEGRKKHRLLITGVLCAAAVVLVLAAAVLLAYRSWARPPSVPEPDGPQPSPTGSAQPDLPEETGPAQELEGVRPSVSGDRKEGMYTFLLVGRDTGGGGNTDTIMLASYDTEHQSAALMSIPRDTMVNATWDVKKINSVYNVNEDYEPGTGMSALKGYVAGLVGFEPDFTVLVEWEAVGEIVDAIGGVYFEVPFRMFYLDPTQDLAIDQEPGYRLLSGEDAMQVVRWRENNCGYPPHPDGTDGSDLGRAKLQQDFIAAMISQCLQIKNVPKLTALAEIFTQRVETELTAGNLCWFAEQALLGGFSTENIYACTMPNTPVWVYSRTQHVQLAYVTPSARELIDLVNTHFNPYQEDVTMANLDIMSVNTDGSLSSSTGTVRDRQAVYPESHWH